MKKKILVLVPVLLGAGTLAFLLVRAERIIQRQQQALNDLSAKVEHLEHNSISSSGAGASADSLKGEVDQLRRTVTNLRTQLAEYGKNYRLDQFGRPIPGSGDVKNRILEMTPNGAVRPYSQAPPQVPPGSIPFEFNGITYYRIPLASAD
jgi:hypothetical protein